MRSGHGSLQGARVVIEQAPTINHSVTLAGSMEDSYFPDGLDNPASFMIDGKVAPEIDVHRGEVHRFYFDKSLEGLPMTFLEKPENTPPRFQINMIADPRPYLTGGSGYLRNPKIAYTTRSAFSAYETNKTGTYLEMLEFLLRDFNLNNITPIDINQTDVTGELELFTWKNFRSYKELDQPNSITRPYAKALMKEANVSTARTGPMEINEAGFYIYGGRGYDRETTPIVKVRRNSIWEDYTKDNATAVAKIDGVGTISPIISSTFMGDSWVTRTGGYQTEAPEVVVWGSGVRPQ